MPDLSSPSFRERIAFTLSAWSNFESDASSSDVLAGVDRGRLAAAQAIIERGYGKPEQSVKADLTGNFTVEIVRFGET